MAFVGAVSDKYQIVSNYILDDIVRLPISTLNNLVRLQGICPSNLPTVDKIHQQFIQYAVITLRSNAIKKPIQYKSWKDVWDSFLATCDLKNI
jgi:hypothetical protein